MVVVRVGPSKHEFFVHKGLLSHHCLYFKNLFEGIWRNGSGLDLIDDDDVDAFKAYFNWLYEHRLPDVAKDLDLENREHRTQIWIQLSKIYVLGDKLQIPALKNAATNSMIDYFIRFNKAPSLEPVKYLFQNTPKSSKGRVLFADIFVSRYKDWEPLADRALGQGENFHEFAWQIICSMYSMLSSGSFKRRSMSQWKSVDKCMYHDHNTIHGDMIQRGRRTSQTGEGSHSVSCYPNEIQALPSSRKPWYPQNQNRSIETIAEFQSEN